MKRTFIPLKTNAQRYALAGICFGLLFPIIATIIYILDSGMPWEVSSIVAAQSSEPLLWMIDTAPIFLGIFAAIAGRRQDKVMEVNYLLRAREKEIEAAHIAMEKRVDERTRELTSHNLLILERANQLKSVAEISRSLLAIQELDRLLPLIVRGIGQNFHVYHVGIYLLDEQKNHALLMASSSEEGLQILKRGHQLRLAGKNLLGYAVRSGQTQIVNDSVTEPMFESQPELPNTRSALILPLISGHTAIGALDLQSDTANAFTEDLVSVLSILADLVTIAIQNSIQHEKTQRVLREVEENSRQSSARVWRGWVDSIKTRGYRYDGIRAEPLNGKETSPSAQRRIQSIPIKLRGRTIGNLKIKLSESAYGWTDDDHAIAEATAERAALALEGARLLDEAKRRAAREAFLSDVAAKLGTSFQLDSVLRDTVEELGKTLEEATVSFHLIDPTESAGMDSGETDEPPSARRS